MPVLSAPLKKLPLPLTRSRTMTLSEVDGNYFDEAPPRRPSTAVGERDGRAVKNNSDMGDGGRFRQSQSVPPSPTGAVGNKAPLALGQPSQPPSARPTRNNTPSPPRSPQVPLSAPVSSPKAKSTTASAVIRDQQGGPSDSLGATASSAKTGRTVLKSGITLSLPLGIGRGRGTVMDHSSTTPQVGNQPGGAAPAAPDASHCAQLGLRLTELVSRAFLPNDRALGVTSSSASAGAAPTSNVLKYGGRKVPTQAAVRAIADAVVNELHYANSMKDAYFLRAVSRQILKALTLFATRIDSLIISPSVDPAVLRVPATAKDSDNVPAAQAFNLALVRLEWEVWNAVEAAVRFPGFESETFDSDSPREGKMPGFVGEILAPARNKMAGTINHIVQPLLNAFKISLAACVANAVVNPLPAPMQGALLLTPGGATSTLESGHATLMIPNGQQAPPQALNATSSSNGASAPTALSAATAWQRELSDRLDGARRLLMPRLIAPCSNLGLTWLTTVASYVIWKGMLALAARPLQGPVEPGRSIKDLPHFAVPFLAVLNGDGGDAVTGTSAVALKQDGGGVKGGGKSNSRSGSSSPQSGRATPIGGSTVDIAALAKGGGALSAAQASAYVRGGTTVPLGGTPRQRAAARLAGDAGSFDNLIRRFVAGFEPEESDDGLDDSDSESSDDDDDDDVDDEAELARAALGEALQALHSLRVALEALASDDGDLVLLALCSRRMAAKGDWDQTCNVGGGAGAMGGKHVSPEVRRAFATLPPLILIHLVYARLPARLDVRPPHKLWNYDWSTYEQQLTGFGASQAWAGAIGEGLCVELTEAFRAVLDRESQVALVEERFTPTRCCRSNGAAATAADVDACPGDDTNALSRTAAGIAYTSRASSPDQSGERHSRLSTELGRRTSPPSAATKGGQGQSAAGSASNVTTGGGATAPPRFWRRSVSAKGLHFPLPLSRTSPPSSRGNNNEPCPCVPPSSAASAAVGSAGVGVNELDVGRTEWTQEDYARLACVREREELETEKRWLRALARVIEVKVGVRVDLESGGKAKEQIEKLGQQQQQQCRVVGR